MSITFFSMSVPQSPYHAAIFIAAGIAAVVANASTSSCDADPNTNHKVKHQDLKNQDPVAWARDSSSKSNVATLPYITCVSNSHL